MKATEQLMSEHEAVMQMLDIVDSASQKLRNNEKVNPLHLEAMIQFLKVFVDQCHHGKEEKLLFPALEAIGIPNQGGPVGVMLNEHVQGRNYIKGMSEAVTEYRHGNNSAIEKFIENAENYKALLTQHIMKENNILFRMADMRLSAAQQQELISQFTALQEAELGQEKYKEFYQVLNELKSIYL